jgi:hypothetical protein
VTIWTREIYQSPNGDRWLLAHDSDTGRVFIRHEPNLPYGKTPKGARQTRPSSNIGSVRGSRKGFNRAMGFRIKGSTPVPVGNLCSEILVMQPAQNWDRQRATDSLDATWDPACPCAAIGACEPHCNIFGRN